MVLAPDRVQRHVLVAHFNGLVLRPGNISSLVKHRIPVCGILVRVPAQELISLTRRIVLVDLHSDRASDIADIVGLRRRAAVAVKVQRNLLDPLRCKYDVIRDRRSEVKGFLRALGVPAVKAVAFLLRICGCGDRRVILDRNRRNFVSVIRIKAHRMGNDRRLKKRGQSKILQN